MISLVLYCLCLIICMFDKLFSPYNHILHSFCISNLCNLFGFICILDTFTFIVFPINQRVNTICDNISIYMLIYIFISSLSLILYCLFNSLIHLMVSMKIVNVIAVMKCQNFHIFINLATLKKLGCIFT